MRSIISLLRTVYLRRNKLLFVALVIVTIAFIAGCTAQGGSAPPPSGPIGGGC